MPNPTSAMTTAASTVSTGPRRGTSTSADRRGAHDGLLLRAFRTACREAIAAIGVALEHVEARAGRGEQHGVPRFCELAGTADRLVHRRCASDRQPVVDGVRDAVGCFADEDDRATLVDERGHERAIRAELVAATGDEHRAILGEAEERRDRSTDVRRLRIVVVMDAAYFRDEGHAVRERAKPAEPVADRERADVEGAGHGDRGRGVLVVVRAVKARFRRAKTRSPVRRSTTATRRDGVVRVRRRTSRCAPGREELARGTRRRPRGRRRRPLPRLIHERVALRVRVSVERVVSIQVIFGDVEEHAHAGAERRRALELKARHLDDEDVEVFADRLRRAGSRGCHPRTSSCRRLRGAQRWRWSRCSCRSCRRSRRWVRSRSGSRARALQ